MTKAWMSTADCSVVDWTGCPFFEKLNPTPAGWSMKKMLARLFHESGL